MRRTEPDEYAYPQHGWSSDPETIRRMAIGMGLTKREYLAGEALNGLLASQFKYEDLADYALKARVVADLLIEELNRRK